MPLETNKDFYPIAYSSFISSDSINSFIASALDKPDQPITFSIPDPAFQNQLFYIRVRGNSGNTML